MREMAVCEICGKKTDIGNKVSFAGNRNRKVRRPNLQKVRAYVDGRRRTITVCTKCLKAGRVVKAV